MLKNSFMKKGLIILFIAALVFSTAGCTASNQENDEVKEKGNVEVLDSTSYPLLATDGAGYQVEIEKKPTRIISLIPSLTEILFALSQGDKVVAVTSYDNYPKNVKDKVEYVFEDGLNPNIEQILKLNPDLIVIGPFNEETTSRIRDLGIPVVKFDPKNVEEVYDTIQKLGLITDSATQANKLTEEMMKKVDSILEKAAQIPEEQKKKVFVEISDQLWTAGTGTFIDELITKAGGINIVHEAGWIQYNEEKVIEYNPDIIISTYGYYDKDAINHILAREGWENIKAIKEKKVINVDSDIVTRPGPRIVDGLEIIAKELYPNLFEK